MTKTDDLVSSEIINNLGLQNDETIQAIVKQVIDSNGGTLSSERILHELGLGTWYHLTHYIIVYHIVIPDGYMITSLMRGKKRQKHNQKTSRKKTIVTGNSGLTRSTDTGQHESEQGDSSEESDTLSIVDGSRQIRALCSRKRSAVSSTHAGYFTL